MKSRIRPMLRIIVLGIVVPGILSLGIPLLRSANHDNISYYWSRHTPEFRSVLLNSIILEVVYSALFAAVLFGLIWYIIRHEAKQAKYSVAIGIIVTILLPLSFTQIMPVTAVTTLSGNIDLLSISLIIYVLSFIYILKRGNR